MARSQVVSKLAAGGLAPWQLELVQALLLRDLSADLSAEELASRCGLSRSYFTRAFKASMGAPPHRWLVRQRIRRAEQMLEGTDESLSAIASSCGFADQSHLTRTFRLAVGTSPGAWRRRRRASAAARELLSAKILRIEPDDHDPLRGSRLRVRRSQLGFDGALGDQRDLGDPTGFEAVERVLREGDAPSADGQA